MLMPTVVRESYCVLLGNLKRHEEALAAYEQAIRLDPENAYAYGGKGIVLRALKRHEEALAAQERAIRLNPDDTFTHTNEDNLE